MIEARILRRWACAPAGAVYPIDYEPGDLVLGEIAERAVRAGVAEWVVAPGEPGATLVERAASRSPRPSAPRTEDQQRAEVQAILTRRKAAIYLQSVRARAHDLLAETRGRAEAEAAEIVAAAKRDAADIMRRGIAEDPPATDPRPRSRSAQARTRRSRSPKA